MDPDLALISALEGSTFELIPMKNVVEQAGYLPAGAPITITASPAKELEDTIELSATLAADGFEVVPHLSARMTRDRDHLAALLKRSAEADLRRTFVVGGDADQVGTFYDGLELLEAMTELGHPFERVGIPCYPEGHAVIPDDKLWEALAAKQPYADYMVTQMCFDPAAIESFVETARANGITLPVMIGLPGVAPIAKLVSIGTRIGVGQSLRFLSKHKNLVGRLVRPGGYSPDELIGELTPVIADPAADVIGFHIYTFNRVDTTEEWRQRMLAALRS